MNGLLSQRLDQMLANLAQSDTNIRGLLTKRGGGLPKTGGGLRKTGGGGLARGRGLAGGGWQNRPKVLKDVEKDDEDRTTTQTAAAAPAPNAPQGSGGAADTSASGGKASATGMVKIGGQTAALGAAAAAQSPRGSAAQTTQDETKQHTPGTAKMLAGKQDAKRPLFLIKPKGHPNPNQWLQLSDSLGGAAKKMKLTPHFFQDGKGAYQHGHQRTLPSGDIILAIKRVDVYRGLPTYDDYLAAPVRKALAQQTVSKLPTTLGGSSDGSPEAKRSLNM